MQATVVESRPLVGLGIQRILQRILDIDTARVISPSPMPGITLSKAELLVMGELPDGYDHQVLQLLGSASSVRGVLYLGAGGTVQWMPPREVAPLLAWLPENALPDAIERTVRDMIAALHAGCCTGQPYGVGVGTGVGTRLGRFGHDSAPGVADDGDHGDHGDDVGGVGHRDTIPRLAPLPPRPRLHDFAVEAQMLTLTQRQYDVLVLLSHGLSIKLISRRLEISVPTVKSHTLQIYRRLAARNKAEAVFMAREKGALLAGISVAADALAA